MTLVRELIRLQTLDTAIQEGKSRLTQILQAQQLPQPLQSAREAHEALLSRQQDRRLAMRDQELELGGLAARISAATDRLYSGQERNPKALQDLELELAALNRRHSELEEALLESMVALEEIDEALRDVGGNRTSLEDAWEKEAAGLQAAQNETALELNELLQERKKQTGRIDRQTLQQYQNLLKTKRGLAVAVVRDDMCQGCRVSLNANVLRAVERGEIVTCSTCGRLLAAAL